MVQRACGKTTWKAVGRYFSRHDTHTLAEMSLLEETLPQHFDCRGSHPGVKPLSYGETPLELMMDLLDWAGLDETQSFADLGCGCGAIVLAAALQARRALGVDLIPGAVRFGIQSAKDLGIENVEFQEGNLLDLDLSSFDVIYCCATAVSAWLAEGLAPRLTDCKPGTRVMTVTHRLKLERVKSVEERVLNFSWGYLQSRSDWRFYLHHLS